ncbi:FecR family protein [Parapedobacter soli]|uniref:FecR family protein n=1 Tax=Parapedobacter soli TaxID=416955 RepID=UPI0021C598DF|nr:FecR family protein [Parapedobacter soli]
MDNQQRELTKLIKGHVEGTLTEAEQQRLAELVRQDTQARKLLEAFEDNEVLTAKLARLDGFRQRADWETILSRYRRKRVGRWATGLGVAATLTIFLLAGWWLVNTPTESGVVADARYGHKNDVLPGGQKAVLTLADGSTMALGDAPLHQQLTDGVALDIGEGAITYKNTEKQADALVYHQLDVPVGGVYELTLADGTRVWVNSNATLRFPVTFAAHERRVSVVGEAFFEVAKDKERPFIVQSKGLEIVAVGTAFNVNSHRKDGSVKAILTEGKIRVSNGQQTQELLPGTGVVATAAGRMDVAPVDIEEALAWKEGYFYFNRKTMGDILDELVRWYGIEVTVKRALPDKQFVGGIKRSETLAPVCALLAEMSGRKFAIDGKKLIVY